MKLLLFLSFFILIPNILFTQIDSLNAGIFYQRGDAFLLKGKPEKAIKSYRKATQANEKLTAAWRGLGICYELLEQYDSTIIHYQKVIGLNPNFSRVIYYELARVYYRNGQYQFALDNFHLFQKLQEINIDAFGFNGEKEAQFEIDYLEKLPRNIRECKNALELQNFSNVEYIQNLGDSINTPNNEYFPYLSNNQHLLFYTSSTYDKVNKTNLNEDLHFSYQKENWQKGKPLDSLITTSQNEGMNTFTRDGVTMIYTVCQQEGVLADGCDLRKAIMKGDSIITIEQLEGDVNSEFWETQAALSCDGKYLYFASNRKGGLGLTDIWVSQKLPDGNWGKAKNLGNNINTKGYEEAPFITNDGKTLFFSSTGHLGMGEQDIFMSHWNEAGYWEAAINLGSPINTAARELGFFLTSDNQKGYFASDRKEGFGGMDIYQFQMPNQFEVAPTTFVEGFVKDSFSQIPVPSYVEMGNKRRVRTDKNGRFFFCLPAGQEFDLSIKENGYLPYQNTYPIPKWDNKSLYAINIYLTPRIIDTPKVIMIPSPPIDTLISSRDPIIHTVYFDFNDFGLNHLTTKRLDQLFATFDTTKYTKIEVFGYADKSGDSDYNLDLSKKRAANVAKYLSLNSINSLELITLGKGENNRFDTNKLNRRVEILFFQK